MQVVDRVYFHSVSDCLKYVEQAQEVCDLAALPEDQRPLLMPQLVNLLSSGQVSIDAGNPILRGTMASSLRPVS